MCSDEPTGNYHLISPQLCRDSECVLDQCFDFTSPNFMVLVHPHLYHLQFNCIGTMNHLQSFGK